MPPNHSNDYPPDSSCMRGRVVTIPFSTFPSQILSKFILDSKNNCYFLSVSSQGGKNLQGLPCLPLTVHLGNVQLRAANAWNKWTVLLTPIIVIVSRVHVSSKLKCPPLHPQYFKYPNSICIYIMPICTISNHLDKCSIFPTLCVCVAEKTERLYKTNFFGLYAHPKLAVFTDSKGHVTWRKHGQKWIHVDQKWLVSFIFFSTTLFYIIHFKCRRLEKNWLLFNEVWFIQPCIISENRIPC